MAKQRIINTKFWDDSYITALTPTEKLLFLYLLTNPLTNISGVYELPARRVAFDTGVFCEEIESAFRKFEADGKVVYEGDWVGIVNFIKYQTPSPKIRQGIAAELKRAPKAITDTLCIEDQSICLGSGTPSHSNSNLIENRSASSFLPLSTAERGELDTGRKELLRRWRA